MNFLWDLFWPVLTIAIVLGVSAGAVAFRRASPGQHRKTGFPHKRILVIGGGVALILAFTAVWHGPLNKAEHFADHIERGARQVLANYEMEKISAVVERNPIGRRIVLSGPADEFQRSELVRIMNEIPGVATVRWTNQAKGFGLPLLVEVELAAFASFSLGLLLAYLLELRRRSRAQWRW
jgi:hypothetical protein